MRRRGSLLTGLLIMLAFVVLLFGIASLAFQQLNYSGSRSDRDRARNCAESVVSLAIGKLLENQDFGKRGTPGADAPITFTGQSEERGWLCFDSTVARAAGWPCSLNNLQSDSPQAGWQRNVPCDVVQLVGVGRCHGQTQVVEALLHTPAFPYCIASTGPMRSQGPLLVGMFNEDKPTDFSPEALLPGHLASRGGGPQSVVLSPESLVTGDVESVGGVVLDPGAVVKGRLRPYFQPKNLPTIDLASYLPDPNRSQTLPDSLAGSTLKGNCIRTGNLEVTGGMHLDKAVVYVRGNVTIHGGLQGYGALIAEGNVTIEGGASLESDNKVAVLSKGDFRLHGDGEGSFFRGLVYTTGDVSMSDVTVVGSFVANKAEANGGSRLELANARMVSKPEPFVMWPERQMFVVDTSRPGINANGDKWLAQWEVTSQGQERLKVTELGKPPRYLSAAEAQSWHPPAGTTPLTLWISAEPDEGGGPPHYFAELNHSGMGHVRRFEIYPNNPGRMLTPILNWLNGRPRDMSPIDLLHFINLLNDGAFDQLQQRAQDFAQNTPRPIEIDLNKFLSPRDRIRTLMWRDLPGTAL